MRVTGVPRIVIPHDIHERCAGWMSATTDEVSWRGLASYGPGEFRVDEVFLPIQESSSVLVRVLKTSEGGNFSQWLTDCIRSGRYYTPSGEIRYRWHMHKHSGNQWDDLFESTTDEDNTEKFGLKEVDWMMVGRGAENGIYRVCLEIFQPLRLSIDHVPVFIEHSGILVLASQPWKNPSLEGISRLELPSNLLPKLGRMKETCYGRITPKEAVYKVPAISSVGSHYHSSGVSDIPKTVEMVPIKVRWLEISSISALPIGSGLTCTLNKHDGQIFCSLAIQAGPWAIEANDLPIDIHLPDSKSIRSFSALEVKNFVRPMPAVENTTPVAKRRKYGRSKIKVL